MDSFIQEVKTELRENMTNLDEVWQLMMLPPDKQQMLETAAIVALRRIEEKDNEMMRLEELYKKTERHLESQQMSNFMAPTIISDLTTETIEQFKEIQQLKALLAIKDKEIEDLMIQVDQERSKALSVLEKFKTE